jgi:photosystem II stability/assembly factor-like uncharacterized protein
MKNYIFILLLVILNSCNRQTKIADKNKPSLINADFKNQSNSTEPLDGIIYFSSDNGLTWKNTSDGLPEKTSIGLGGIAVSNTLLGVTINENGVNIFDFQKNIWENIPTDTKIIENNLKGLAFHKDEIYVGTQFGGIFSTNNQGKTWTTKNLGLTNLTIRRFDEINNKLYAGTNDGLYSYDDSLSKWKLEYGQSALQVNGITELDGNIYIGTNQGAFKSDKESSKWKKVFSNGALHNISAFGNTIYAMTYNELFSSNDKGESWLSIQKGLPKELYTFNVIKNNNSIFAGQWDGIYRKDTSNEDWKFTSNGLPSKFSATNFKAYKGILIISCAERKLKTGLTTEK